MTDRELLQAAAKAAGMVRMVYRNDVPYVSFSLSGDDFFAWDPLTDDGEALRLAVALRLLESSPLGDMGVTDPYAATRRAIVRAAAEIGQGISQPTLAADLPEDNYYKTQAEAFGYGGAK